MDHKRVKLAAAAVVVGVLGVLVNNAQRNRHYLTRSGVVTPEHSAWAHLLEHGDNNTFLTITGFDRESFTLLWLLVEEPAERDFRLNGNRRRGRPALLDLRGKVAVLLMFLNSRMYSKNIGLIFGILPVTVDTIVPKMLDRVTTTLRNHADAAVHFPEDATLLRARTPFNPIPRVWSA